MNEVSLTVNLAGPQPRNPVAIFHLAQGFFLAGNRCLLNIDVGPGVTQCLVSPAVVNLCMAIELFLKAVVVHGGGSAPKSHKLAELIKLVPVAFRDSLKSSFDAVVPNPNFDVVVPQINEYFVKVRYGHEFNIFAFHEHAVYVLAKLLYVQAAEHVGQRSGLELIRG